MQVLLGAPVQSCHLAIAGLGARPIQRAEVRHDVEQAVLAGEQVGVGGVGDLGKPALLHHEALQRGGGEVVAEDVAAERVVDALTRLAGEVDRAGVTPEIECGRIAGEVRLVGTQTDQWGAALDLLVGVDRDRGDLAGDRSRDDRLHLHRLEHGDRVADGDGLSEFDPDRHHQGRPTGTHDLAVVAVDPVPVPVDVDVETGVGRGDHDPVTASATCEPPLEVPDPLDLEFDLGGVASVPDRVPGGTGPVDGQVVRPAPVGEFDPVADVGQGNRSTASRGGEERLLCDRHVGLVGLDRSGEQRRSRRLDGRELVGRGPEPLDVDRPVEEVGVIEERQEFGPVGGRTVDDDRHPPQGSTKASDRRLSVGPPGGQHRHDRVGRIDGVAGAAVGVDAHTRAGGERQQCDLGTRFDLVGEEADTDGDAVTGRGGPVPAGDPTSQRADRRAGCGRSVPRWSRDAARPRCRPQPVRTSR